MIRPPPPSPSRPTTRLTRYSSASSVWPRRPMTRPLPSPLTARRIDPGSVASWMVTVHETPRWPRTSSRSARARAAPLGVHAGASSLAAEDASRETSAEGAPTRGRSGARTRALRPPKPHSPRVASVNISISTRSRSTWSVPSAFAMASSMLSPSHSIDLMRLRSSGCRPQIPVLLADGEEVVDQPVQHEPGREVDEHEGEHEGHEHHHALLGRVPLLGRQPLLDEHAGAHHERQNGYSSPDQRQIRRDTRNHQAIRR